MPRRDPAGRVENEHRVVLDAVEHELDARLDLPQPTVGRGAILLAPLADELRVIERSPRIARHLPEHREVVFRKERSAPLGDDDDAPGVAGRTNRRDQDALGMRRNRARDLGLALGRQPIDRHPLVERAARRARAPVPITLPTSDRLLAAAISIAFDAGDVRSATNVTEPPPPRTAAWNTSSAGMLAAFFRVAIVDGFQVLGLLRSAPARQERTWRGEGEVETNQREALNSLENRKHRDSQVLEPSGHARKSARASSATPSRRKPEGFEWP